MDDTDPLPLKDRIPGETAVRRMSFRTQVRTALQDAALERRIRYLRKQYLKMEPSGMSPFDGSEFVLSAAMGLK